MSLELNILVTDQTRKILIATPGNDQCDNLMKRTVEAMRDDPLTADAIIVRGHNMDSELEGIHAIARPELHVDQMNEPPFSNEMDHILLATRESSRRVRDLHSETTKRPWA